MSPSDPDPPKCEDRVSWVWRNWLWLLLYGGIALYVIARLGWSVGGLPGPLKVGLGALWAVLFVHIFTNPILEESAAQAGETEKRQARAAASAQRRYWMIFAYSTMLLSLLIPIFMLSVGWEAMPNDKLKPGAPIAVFLGCSLGEKERELDCFAHEKELQGVVGGAQAASAPAASNAPGKKPTDAANAEVKETWTEVAGTTPVANSAWVINLGGYVRNVPNCGTPGAVCQVHGGLLVPLYVVILSLMGGSISLTRRLPEYQKLANPNHVPVEGRPKLSQHEFREFLVFQIAQLISAPLIAVLAYYLVEPKDVTTSVVLGFIAGFSSESILMMVRAVADKITPRKEAQKYGNVSGVVTSRGSSGGDAPVTDAEVALQGSSVVRTVTDKSGYYVLANVPLGEHSIKVSSPTRGEASDSVKLERAELVVGKHWQLSKAASEAATKLDEGGAKSAPQSGPTLEKIERVGRDIKLTGKQFGNDPGMVKFADKEEPVTDLSKWKESEITVTVPSDLARGKAVDVVVKTKDGKLSNPMSFPNP